MSFRIGLVFIAFLFITSDTMGQKKDSKFFYDTLIIMDHTTGMASERLSQLRKPLKRTFYLKSGETSYTLFKGNVANLTGDQVIALLESGFSLYLDKAEHKGHKNLKPGVLDFLAEDDSVTESLEPLSEVNMSVLRKMLTVGKKIRLSGFIISVNEAKNGPILMDVMIVE